MPPKCTKGYQDGLPVISFEEMTGGRHAVHYKLFNGEAYEKNCPSWLSKKMAPARRSLGEGGTILELFHYKHYAF